MDDKNTNSNNKAKKKKFEININKMGVNIDKNEYQEIILSNSNHPERSYFKNYRDY